VSREKQRVWLSQTNQVFPTVQSLCQEKPLSLAGAFRSIRFVADGHLSALEDMGSTIEGRGRSYYCFLEANLLSVAAGDSRLCEILQAARGVFPRTASPARSCTNSTSGVRPSALPGPRSCHKRANTVSSAAGATTFTAARRRRGEDGGEPQARLSADDCCRTYSPPFRALTPEEEGTSRPRSRRHRPTFLLVGLGGPKQEYWMAKHLGQVHVPVMLALAPPSTSTAGIAPGRGNGQVARVGVVLSDGNRRTTGSLPQSEMRNPRSPCFCFQAWIVAKLARKSFAMSAGSASGVRHASRERPDALGRPTDGPRQSRLGIHRDTGLCRAGSSSLYAKPALRRAGRGGVRKWAFAGTFMSVVFAAMVFLIRKGLFPSPLEFALAREGCPQPSVTYSASPTLWAFLGGSFVLTVLPDAADDGVGRARWGRWIRAATQSLPDGDAALGRAGGRRAGFSFCCLLGLVGPTSMLRLVADKHTQLLAILIGGLGSVAVGLVGRYPRHARAAHSSWRSPLRSSFASAGSPSIRSRSPSWEPRARTCLFGGALTVLWIVPD